MAGIVHQMLSTYRHALSTAPARQLVIPGFISRLPSIMNSIALVLTVAQISGSYSLSGAITAVYYVCAAITTPCWARLMDSHGQRRVGFPLMALHVVTLTSVGLVAMAGKSTVVIGVLAGLSGLTQVSWGSVIRARWVYVLQDSPPTTLDSAYALESMLDEIGFVVGPVVAATIATQAPVGVALLTSALLTAIGVPWLLHQRASEPPTIHNGKQKLMDVVTRPGIRGLLVCLALLGVIFGSVEVSVAAIADHVGLKQWTGQTVACFAGGSLISGLWVGSRAWTMKHQTRVSLGATLIAVGLFGAIFAPNLWWVGAAVFVAGWGIAPSTISAASLIADLSPRKRITEGFAWMSLMITLGSAAGAAMAGTVAHDIGAQPSFLIAVASAALVALIMALNGYCTHRHSK